MLWGRDYQCLVVLCVTVFTNRVMEITRSIMPTIHVPNITLASIMRTFQGKMKEGWVV